MRARVGSLVGVLVVLALPSTAARANVLKTVHNLSATGPGTVKAPRATDPCGFCHAPHRAVQTRALWNRELPPTTYKLYESSTLEANIKQPTGASRLCLSCHDGTTALGALRVPQSTGRVTLGPLTGRASLGTDLSDDHPISFVYDSPLALRRGELADPSALGRLLRLDDTQQLQCTSCHEPHEDQYRSFLRGDDRAGALCTTCHRISNWADSAHATSPATWRGTGANPWPGSPYTTVLENACMNCHRSHAAPHPERLLSSARESGVCLACHNGSVAQKDLQGEFTKPSAHPIFGTDWTHDPREDPRSMRRHVTCADCHNPHQATDAPGLPVVSGRLRGVRGLDSSGVPVPVARQEYEVCLKCHGVRDQTTTGILRQDNIRNIRLKLSPSNPSYHPVTTAGRNASVSNFETGYTSSSVIGCGDCHNSDQASRPGGPRGAHGSVYTPLLERNYQTTDPAIEAYQTYAACYKCHNRDALINDRARTFPHRRHVIDDQAPCAVCHDAHGSRQNPALVNFMLRDPTGKTIVGATQSQHRLEYVSQGAGRGQCFLICHGKNHEPLAYP